MSIRKPLVIEDSTSTLSSYFTLPSSAFFSLEVHLVFSGPASNPNVQDLAPVKLVRQNGADTRPYNSFSVTKTCSGCMFGTPSCY
eukprot:393643-Amphidinium_carterae.1